MISATASSDNGTTTANDESASAKAGVGDVVRDIASLTELQLKLLKVEGRRARRLIVFLAIATALAVASLIGAMPVALTAIGYWLAESQGLSLAQGLAIGAAVGLAIAAVAVIVAWKTFVSATRCFEQSRNELAKNFRWLKHSSGRQRS